MTRAAKLLATCSPAPIVFQTAFESAPKPASGNSQQADECNKTGSLVTLVPFVMNHTNAPLRVLELYFADLEGTYVTGYQDTCWASGTSVPYAPYDDVLRAATTP